MSVAPQRIKPYVWSPSTEALARRAGLDVSQVVRFDDNVPAVPPASARTAAIARALAGINDYDRDLYPVLRGAIARRHGVEPDNIVLAAGSDDLILICARTFAASGRIALVPERTYSMYRIAATVAAAEIVDDPMTADLTFVCRPNNPTGELTALPNARLAVVDEAYAEYAGENVVDQVSDTLIVLRTFSKAFGLAGARVAYAVATPARAEEIMARQAPLTIAAPSAALALAALAEPLDVGPQIAERERLAEALRGFGLSPLPSCTNFVFVPMDDPNSFAEQLLQQGLVVRRFEDGVRVSVRDRYDDDLLLAGIAGVLGRTPTLDGVRPTETVRHLRATAETRIRIRLRLHGEGRVLVDTGCGFYDHMLQQLAFHGGMDLYVDGAGDLETGEHHLVEDLMRAFGEALDRALADRAGMARYGEARVPMDEALAHAVVDLSGRPVSRIQVEPDPGMAAHALESLAQTARITLHVEARGDNAHHTAEATFKAVGRALRAATRVDGGTVASTKGSL
ncbi:MAG: hypothetical protein NVSMB29_14540 [Candidatus Dormibacteria bacterium]